MVKYSQQKTLNFQTLSKSIGFGKTKKRFYTFDYSGCGRFFGPKGQKIKPQPNKKLDKSFDRLLTKASLYDLKELLPVQFNKKTASYGSAILMDIIALQTQVFCFQLWQSHNRTEGQKQAKKNAAKAYKSSNLLEYGGAVFLYNKKKKFLPNSSVKSKKVSSTVGSVKPKQELYTLSSLNLTTLSSYKKYNLLQNLIIQYSLAPSRLHLNTSAVGGLNPKNTSYVNKTDKFSTFGSKIGLNYAYFLRFGLAIGRRSIAQNKGLKNKTFLAYWLLPLLSLVYFLPSRRELANATSPYGEMNSNIALTASNQKMDSRYMFSEQKTALYKTVSFAEPKTENWNNNPYSFCLQQTAFGPSGQNATNQQLADFYYNSTFESFNTSKSFSSFLSLGHAEEQIKTVSVPPSNKNAVTFNVSIYKPERKLDLLFNSNGSDGFLWLRHTEGQKTKATNIISLNQNNFQIIGNRPIENNRSFFSKPAFLNNSFGGFKTSSMDCNRSKLYSSNVEAFGFAEPAAKPQIVFGFLDKLINNLNFAVLDQGLDKTNYLPFTINQQQNRNFTIKSRRLFIKTFLKWSCSKSADVQDFLWLRHTEGQKNKPKSIKQEILSFIKQKTSTANIAIPSAKGEALLINFKPEVVLETTKNSSSYSNILNNILKNYQKSENSLKKANTTKSSSYILSPSGLKTTINILTLNNNGLNYASSFVQRVYPAQNKIEIVSKSNQVQKNSFIGHKPIIKLYSPILTASYSTTFKKTSSFFALRAKKKVNQKPVLTDYTYNLKPLFYKKTKAYGLKNVFDKTDFLSSSESLTKVGIRSNSGFFGIKQPNYEYLGRTQFVNLFNSAEYSNSKILQNYLPKTEMNSSLWFLPEGQTVKAEPKRNFGSRQTIFQNSLPIVLQHKKFFKIQNIKNTLWLRHTEGQKEAVKLPILLQQYIKETLKTMAEGREEAFSPSTKLWQSHKTFGLSTDTNAQQNLIAIGDKQVLEQKKYNQKKRKAKKQRLETRRKKKRKRFYPRPTWLRLRLGFSKAQKALTQKCTDKKPFILQKPYSRAQSPHHFNTQFLLPANNHIQTLNNLNSKTIYKKNIIDFGRLSNMLNKPDVSLAKKIQKNTIYNNIVYNLWLASKKQKSYNYISNSESHTSKTTALDLKQKDLRLWFGKAKTKSNLAAKYSYKNHLLSPKSLISFQNNSSYAVFEDKSNQNPPKKETNPNTFRDFWIWLYNTTNTNTLNRQVYIHNILEFFNIYSAPYKKPTAFYKSQPVTSGDSNKEKNLSFGSAEPKQLGFGEAELKVSPAGLQEKQNKPKFEHNLLPNFSFMMERGRAESAKQKQVFKFNQKARNRVYWSLNKTNLWSSNNQRIHFWSTQKLRNQSKNNKTKYIEKQIKKQLANISLNTQFKSFANLFAAEPQQNVEKVSFENSFLNYQKMSLPKSSLYRISQKIHQKEMKFKYLAANLKNDGFYKEPKKGHSGSFFVAQRATKNKGQIAKFFNLKNPNSNNANLSNPFLTKPSSNFIWFREASPFLSSFSEIEQKGEFISPKGLTILLSKTDSFENSFSLLFHFCALLSLISISQIRCFIKFHLILIYKLSNIYLQLIYKNQSFTKKLGLNTIAKRMFGAKHKSLNPIVESKSFIRSYFGPVGQKIKNKPNLVNRISIGRKVTKPYNTSQSSFAQPYSVFLSGLGLTNRSVFSFTKKAFFGLTKPAAKPQIGNLKNPTLPGVSRPILNKLTYSKTDLFLVQNVLFNELPSLGIKTSKFPAINQDRTKSFTQAKPTYNNLNPVFSKVYNLTSFLVQLSLFLAKKRIIATNIRQKLVTQNRSEAFGQAKPDMVAGKTQIQQTNFINFLIFQKNFKEEKTKTINFIKKGTYNTSLQVVDTFEYFLRLVYGFFEKPAELTMDWVAYAFLVEWSSDLLTFTPENKDKQNWIAFSKIARQTRSLSYIYLNSFGLVSSAKPLAYSINSPSTALFYTSNLILSQFLYKRFLYLNDIFIEILNRPDTDLINRQKKGTLFWDIWSDILMKAADQYNINVPSLSNIKEEQNVLIDKFLAFGVQSGQVDVKDSKFSKRNQKKKLLALQNLFGSGAAALAPSTRQFSPTVWRSHNTEVYVLPNRSVLNASGSKNRNSSVSAAELSLIPKYNQENKKTTEFITYQSKETDLFLDYHPPKSFSHIGSIQYLSLVQQPIGTLVCQIYSGILNKQISKNILVIGSTLNSKTNTAFERMQKTLLIQALAGETEMKIITDNAQRYAVVNRGFAVGIKLLKDVFEAIALNTPCLFLLEDIHLIGERRPMLISDYGDSVGDEMSKSTEIAFGAQRNGAAVHEKNQVLYQFTRHGLTHYQKPFKGDFSLSIPTNHFAFDLFLKSSDSFAYANFASTPTNPLAYSINYSSAEGGDQDISGQKASKNSEDAAVVQKLISKRKLGSDGQTKQAFLQNQILSSSLQIMRNKLLSPPSTSPFTVLLLKEQKKFNPKKLVQELPWFGLPTEQLSLLPRVSYSVRAKVAALADFSFSNMSAKFDMITDLLVIIDSVRGNRGFVVFATTHLPHILDPALRRPGRLDETISIPTLSNLWSRWEFTKAPQPIISTPLLGSAEPKPSLTTASYKPFYNITGKTSFISNLVVNNFVGYHGTLDYLDFLNLDFLPNQATNILNPILTNLNLSEPRTNIVNFGSAEVGQLNLNFTENQKTVYANIAPKKPKFINKLLSKKQKNIAYYQMGRKLIQNIYFGLAQPRIQSDGLPANLNINNKQVWQSHKTKLVWNLFNFSPLYNNVTTSESTTGLTETRDFLSNEIQYKSIYASTHVIQHRLIGLISGKISELFAFNTVSGCAGLNKSNSTAESAEGLASILYYLPKANVAILNKFTNRLSVQPSTLYGIDQTWRSAMSLAVSFVQKRYLYNQNLIVPKLLSFVDYASLEEAPSPPSSNILIPAKRYENYKKVFKENVAASPRKIRTSSIGSELYDKIETHVKQSFIQSINRFGSAETNNNQNNIESSNKQSLRTLAALEAIHNPLSTIQPTNMNVYYQTKLLKRHRNYLTNQWWTGQLIEHNAETLFLSDIDWRYTFINSPQPSKNSDHTEGYNSKNSSIKDILLDFPDSDQHYNPKNRRWMLNAGFWSSWFDFDQKIQTEIFNHFILDCFINSFNILNQNREFLDYSVTQYIQKGLVKEIDIIHSLQKFR